LYISCHTASLLLSFSRLFFAYDLFLVYLYEVDSLSNELLVFIAKLRAEFVLMFPVSLWTDEDCLALALPWREVAFELVRKANAFSLVLRSYAILILSSLFEARLRALIRSLTRVDFPD